MPPDHTADTDGYLLGQMNAKLDTLIQRSHEDRETIVKLTSRVERLEAWRWMLIGAATAAGSAASLITKAIS
jgi:hypothetical protein